MERMHAVTADATYIGLAMGRAVKIRMCSAMALETFVIDDLRCGLDELEYLCCVTAGFHMLFPGPMAALASNSLASMHQCKAGVRIIRKLLQDLRMAGLADLGADIVVRINSIGLLRRRGLL